MPVSLKLRKHQNESASPTMPDRPGEPNERAFAFDVDRDVVDRRSAHVDRLFRDAALGRGDVGDLLDRLAHDAIVFGRRSVR